MNLFKNKLKDILLRTYNFQINLNNSSEIYYCEKCIQLESQLMCLKQNKFKENSSNDFVERYQS